MDRSKKPYYNGNISENRIFCILQDYIYIYMYRYSTYGILGFMGYDWDIHRVSVHTLWPSNMATKRKLPKKTPFTRDVPLNPIQSPFYSMIIISR
jgi:hypothetical protein